MEGPDQHHDLQLGLNDQRGDGDRHLVWAPHMNRDEGELDAIKC